MPVGLRKASSVDEVAAAFRAARRITAVCHANPDADTVGAAVAVTILANRLGAEAEIVSSDGIPPAFDFLPMVHAARRRPMLEPDLVVICDAATLDRVGRLASDPPGWLSKATVLNIDHHLTSNYFGDINLVDAQAAATCEVLAGLIDSLGVPIDADLATALLTGIVRDSGGFSAESTSPATLRVAARLVEAGAPLAQIHRRVLSELPYATLTLWGRLLATAKRADDDRIVYTVLTLDMLDETGTQQHDADGLVEFLASTVGVEVTLLIRQLGSARTRVSVRTSGSVDATVIAAQFGGGGHARRAGYTLDQSVADSLAPLLATCARALE